ncbi:MAG TPA: hypothetical protein VG032_05075 [Acidimicrobiales bacterium]|nr:hypothetical protein [Acidimicrobiales bacterium]
MPPEPRLAAAPESLAAPSTPLAAPSTPLAAPSEELAAPSEALAAPSEAVAAPSESRAPVREPFPAPPAPPPVGGTMTEAIDLSPAGPLDDLGPELTLTEPRPSPPESDLPAGPGRAWPRWIIRPVLIYLASRALAWATLAVTTIFTHVGVGGEIDRWDSRWFIRAAEFGWPSQLPHHNGHVAANTIAFLPVFPLSIRWLSHLTGFSLLTAGVIVTSLSGLTAMIGVWLVIRAYSNQDAADRGTLLVAMFPGSFVLSMVYSEGLVITFVAFGILALMRRRWLLAGVLGMLATATTPIALGFEISCLWCAYGEITKNRDWRSLVAPVLTPLGFLAYQVWLWFHTGDVSAWRVTERGGWKSYPSLVYAAHTVGVFLRNPIATNKTDDLLFVGTVLTVVAAVIAIRSRLPMPLLLYGLVTAGIAVVSAPVGLRPRFMFLAFPLIIAVGTWFRGRAYVWLVSISMVLLVFATAYEVSSWAVFP